MSYAFTGNAGGSVQLGKKDLDIEGSLSLGVGLGRFFDFQPWTNNGSCGIVLGMGLFFVSLHFEASYFGPFTLEGCDDEDCETCNEGDVEDHCEPHCDCGEEEN
jgi:hypothetical protein